MKRLRAVLDTSVVISALIFKGEVSRLHSLWKKKAFTVIASGEIVEEYIKVLAYPKFDLTERDIENIIQEEIIPYIEPVTVTDNLSGVCVDPDDDKFLACAEAAKADAIVSGDAHLLSMKMFKGCPILTAEKFLRKFR